MNEYIRVGVSAMIAAYGAPKIINALVRPELTPLDSTINTAMGITVVGALTAFSFVALGMLKGG